MLQKEREKEAGRPLNLQESATVFPTLLPSDGIAPASASKQSQATSSSVLLVGDASGAVHLYLGGSVYLGTVQLESGSQVVGVAVLPSTSTATRLSVTTQSERVTLHRVALDLPPTLELITQQSTSLRSTIQHAFDALQEARALWDESRRIGKAWMARLADVSKTHASELSMSWRCHGNADLMRHSCANTRHPASAPPDDWPPDNRTDRLLVVKDERESPEQVGGNNSSGVREAKALHIHVGRASYRAGSPAAGRAEGVVGLVCAGICM